MPEDLGGKNKTNVGLREPLGREEPQTRCFSNNLASFPLTLGSHIQRDDPRVPRVATLPSSGP